MSVHVYNTPYLLVRRSMSPGYRTFDSCLLYLNLEAFSQVSSPRNPRLTSPPNAHNHPQLGTSFDCLVLDGPDILSEILKRPARWNPPFPHPLVTLKIHLCS